jgi:serpin B
VVPAIVALGCLAVGCGAPTGREIRSDAAPAEPANVPAGGVAALNSFSLDLERTVAAKGGNVALTTYPIARALAMARVGARGETLDAIDRVLHVERTSDLDGTFTALDAVLGDRTGEQRSSTRKGEVSLLFPSALWLQQNIRVAPNFLDTLAIRFDTGVRVVDFRSDPDEGRNAVNRWAMRETDSAVDLLVPRGEITDFTRFVAASAGALRAPWAVRFDPDATAAAAFVTENGRVDVPTMRTEDPRAFGSMRAPDLQAVELPYLGGQLAMLIVVPDHDRFDDVASSLDAESLEDIVGGLQPRPTAVQVPRFQFTTDLVLDEALGSLGMGIAFATGRADFTGITGDERLAISDAPHATYVSVDEEGSDGDAVTVVPQPGESTAVANVIAVDRPFLFVVRDRVTGLILQVGRVVDPQS